MTRKISRLASPNTDLGIDRNGRVYKVKADGWKRLNEHFPPSAGIVQGRGPYQTTEVIA